MDFEWDENKRLPNIAKHGIDFFEAQQLFAGDHIKTKAKVGLDGEERFLATGIVYGTYVTVVDTERESAARIISLRKARKNEQRKHEALFSR